MTNEDMLRKAMEQSARDSSCREEDFLSHSNIVVESKPHPQARRYLKLPFACDLVSYGTNIVASVSRELVDEVRNYINSYPVEHCFETPNLHVLNDLLKRHGLAVCFMAEYFLPDLERLTALSCPYSLRLLMPDEFSALYLPQWENALCGRRKELDKLALGAYDGDTLIGLAGCSADCDTMWQIGVDVLPAYRRQGIASALTSGLALEILNREKVPFYCAAWSNLKSVRNALKSGFSPAWVELTAKELSFIEDCNRLSG